MPRNQTYGTPFMHRSLVAMLRCVPVHVFYAFTALCVVPVCLLLNAPARRSTYRFLRHRIGWGRARAAAGTYRNFCLFAQVVVDRFAMYAGRRFNTTVVGYEHYKRLAALPGAFLQFSAHVGNYELAGYTLTADNKPFNALVFAGEKATVMQERDTMFGTTNIRMIPVAADLSHLLAINAALAAGETVSMPADRSVGAQRTIPVALLGATTPLPAGPFATAVMRALPVLAVNVMKTAPTAYTIYVTPLHYDTAAPRPQQQRQLAQAYADELANVMRRHPTQWYNYDM